MRVRINDSGVEWIGEIPEGWEVVRLKQAADVTLSNVDKRSREGEPSVGLCNYTDVYYNEFIDGSLNFMRATASHAHIERLTLRRGDVLITKDSESPDDIAVPAVVSRDLPGVVCGYHLSHVRPLRDKLDGHFLFRVLQAEGARAAFGLLANGITRYGIPLRAIAGFPVPLPPLPTQRAIAAFLDRETERIDTLIKKKERLLELLGEKRSALISHAVTRGLDPDVPLKDSGVEWIGEIPEGWEVVRLRRAWTVVDCLHSTPEYVSDGYPLVSTGEVSRGSIDLSGTTRFVNDESFLKMSRGGRHMRKGDIVYSRNASLGVAAYVDTSEPFCMGQDVVRITSDLQDQRFLTYVLNSNITRGQVAAVGVGSTFSRINVADIKALYVPLPSVVEQHAIADHLDAETSRIDALKTKVTEAIARLKEYRTALISAAVTGQLEVPELDDEQEEVA